MVIQAKNLLLSKNQGNLLQDFIWQTEQFDPKAVDVPGVPVDKELAQQHGNKAMEGLRTLGTLIITNGQFRKLRKSFFLSFSLLSIPNTDAVKDATVLLRDMAGDAATNAAQHVRPSGEALENLDRPAEDNTWHDAPDFSKENFKKQAQNVYKGSPADDVRDVANAGTQAAHPNGAQNPQDLAAIAARDQQQGTVSGVDAQNGTSAARNVLEKKYNENVDDETKEKARQRKEEYRRRTKEYFNKKMPQERKDQTIWRLKKMVLECQQHPDYAQAIETLLDLAEEYAGHSRTIAQGGTSTVRDTRAGLAQAESDLKVRQFS